MEERADLFAVIVFGLLLCGCQCFVILPCSAVGWSGVCDCGTSCSDSLVVWHITVLYGPQCE